MIIVGFVFQLPFSNAFKIVFTIRRRGQHTFSLQGKTLSINILGCVDPTNSAASTQGWLCSGKAAIDNDEDADDDDKMGMTAFQ